jgi:hypothetical protein
VGKLKLLFIEDERDTIEVVVDSLSKDHDCMVVGFEESEDVLEGFMPHVVVLDLVLGGLSPEAQVPGLDIFNYIWDHRFCPIVVFSAEPDLLESPRHPFVKRVKKGTDGLKEVMKVLTEFSPHVEALQEAEAHIRQQFADALRIIAPYAFEAASPEDTDQPRDMIVRGARRRLAAKMDDLAVDGKKLAPWEQYLWPPVSTHLRLGDVLHQRSESLDNPASFRVVLTPSCDLVRSEGRAPKVAAVLVARCVSMREAIASTSLGNLGKEKLLKRIQSTLLTPGYLETILPMPVLPKLIPPMAAQLKDLEFLSFKQIENDYDSVASVDSPFRELVAWAYMLVACRPGLPDRDFSSWITKILEQYGEEKKDGKA